MGIRVIKTTRVPIGIELLYREESKKLWWAVLAYAGSSDVADDAVAEAFAQALGRGSDLREPRAWL
jgi:DNA-directed RNA polymerase specialized sigma24 family protein